MKAIIRSSQSDELVLVFTTKLKDIRVVGLEAETKA